MIEAVRRRIQEWFRTVTHREPMEVRLDPLARQSRLGAKGLYFARLDQASVPRGRSIKHRATLEYPLLTIGFYGPDDATVCKIVLSQLPSQKGEPVLLRKTAEGILDDVEFLREAEAFIQRHAPKAVTAPGGTIGCPHEEGVDFPDGGDCMKCPFWRGKQGSMVAP